jgi:hypothetical protein
MIEIGQEYQSENGGVTLMLLGNAFSPAAVWIAVRLGEEFRSEPDGAQVRVFYRDPLLRPPLSTALLSFVDFIPLIRGCFSVGGGHPFSEKWQIEFFRVSFFYGEETFDVGRPMPHSPPTGPGLRRSDSKPGPSIISAARPAGPRSHPE